VQSTLNDGVKRMEIKTRARHEAERVSIFSRILASRDLKALVLLQLVADSRLSADSSHFGNNPIFPCDRYYADNREMGA